MSEDEELPPTIEIYRSQRTHLAEGWDGGSRAIRWAVLRNMVRLGWVAVSNGT